MKNRELLEHKTGIVNILSVLTIEDDELMEKLIMIEDKITVKIEAVNKIRRADKNFMTYMDRIEEIKKDHAVKDKKGEIKKIAGTNEYDVPAEKHNVVNYEIEQLNEEFKATLDIQEKFLDKDSGIKDKIKKEEIPEKINGLMLLGIKALWI